MKEHTSSTLSGEARDIAEALASENGVSVSAIIEMAIRYFYRSERVQREIRRDGIALSARDWTSWHVSGIYGIRCEASGRFYVGQSFDVAARIAEHANSQTNGRSGMSREMRRYGLESFTVKLLEEVGDLSQLDYRERFWMESLGGLDSSDGYNRNRKIPAGDHPRNMREPLSQGILEWFGSWDGRGTVKDVARGLGCSVGKAHAALMANSWRNVSPGQWVKE